MTTARQFLDLVRRYEQFKAASSDPERLLMEMTDEQLLMLIQTAAGTFNMLRKEAQRRGTWDGLVQKGLGMKKSELT